MRKSEKTRSEESFSRSSGAPSDLDDLNFVRGEDIIEGFGLTAVAMRSVARRQLVGSIVVALLIAAAVGVAAMKPIRKADTTAPTHRFAVIRQPTFVLPDQRMSKRENFDRQAGSASPGARRSGARALRNLSTSAVNL